MSSKSKSSQHKTSSSTSSSKTLSQFDRGSTQLLNHFCTLTKAESISLQLLFFALLEVFSLNLTNNDLAKSPLLSHLLLHFLQTSKILPSSMTLSAKSIRQQELFQNYVRILKGSVQTALCVLQNQSSTGSDESTITSVLERDYAKALLTTSTTPNISIDIPQADIQLKVPIAITMDGTVKMNDFDNIVVFRYVRDFYEIDKLGKGAFGSVFQARNCLDNRVYAIKKIIFNENTEQTRRQAKRALREVRVLASLSHPNIVQYHCAWLELVPIEPRASRTSSSSAAKLSQKTLPQIEQPDSVDELIEFERQSTSEEQKDETSEKSWSTSDEDDEDESEISASGTNGHLSDLEICHQYHSDGHNPSLSSSKRSSSHSSSQHKRSSSDNLSNKELVPLHSRSQIIHPSTQSNHVNTKLVLFIQMQLCDSNLHDWLRYRDPAIIEGHSDPGKRMFHTLNELGQNQSWRIFKQLLSAVEYLHSQSFVHRDIKPRNIFLAYDTKDLSSVHVKLGDFGLATLLDSPSAPEYPEEFHDQESSGVGTALYAPPEQLNSSHCVPTDKSDSYSLGIVLFELFNIYSTEMDRHHSISNLRVTTKVERAFAECYPFETRLIEQLVSIDHEERPSVEQLLAMYTKEYQQRTKKQQQQTNQMIIEQLQEILRDKDKRIRQLELQLEKKN